MRVSKEAGGQNDRGQRHRVTEDVGCRERADGKRV